jgi:hypothetical protein
MNKIKFYLILFTNTFLEEKCMRKTLAYDIQYGKIKFYFILFTNTFLEEKCMRKTLAYDTIR